MQSIYMLDYIKLFFFLFVTVIIFLTPEPKAMISLIVMPTKNDNDICFVYNCSVKQ